jgi:hypothetical protein
MRALSLRTDRQPEAMVRAQGLDRVIEAARERARMDVSSSRPLARGAIDRIIDDLLVRERARMIEEHEPGLAPTRAGAQAALAARCAERAALREEARLRAYEGAKPVSAEISARLG